MFVSGAKLVETIEQNAQVLSTTKPHNVTTNYFTGKRAQQGTRRIAKVSLFRLILMSLLLLLLLPSSLLPPPLLLVLTLCSSDATWHHTFQLPLICTSFTQ
jgi:hypothetical protein